MYPWDGVCGPGKEGIITMNAKESIVNGKAALGIEFGSTRIKAVLVDENCKALASVYPPLCSAHPMYPFP